MRRADAIDATVGENIRVLRLARDMSQGALASKIGLSFQQLQKYEKGTNRISAGRLWKVAQIFNVPIAVLYDGVPGRLGTEASALSLITNRDAVRLVQAFDKIEDRGLRRAIVIVVERIAAVDG
jgi:transcriptional regulator with XRE-family HTH domain